MKFKVGDMVRVIDTDGGHLESSMGFVGRIKEAEELGGPPDNEYYEIEGLNDGCWFARRLELAHKISKKGRYMIGGEDA